MQNYKIYKMKFPLLDYLNQMLLDKFYTIIQFNINLSCMHKYKDNTNNLIIKSGRIIQICFHDIYLTNEFCI